MSVRGFFPNSIGPKLEVPQSSRPDAPLISVNKGGDKQVVINAEIEIPIIPKARLRGVLFSDAGMAFDDDQWVSLTNLRHSWGFGFRWFSPIGPLRFEWGFPYSPRSNERPMVFQFTIGNFF